MKAPDIIEVALEVIKVFEDLNIPIISEALLPALLLVLLADRAKRYMDSAMR